MSDQLQSIMRGVEREASGGALVPGSEKAFDPDDTSDDNLAQRLSVEKLKDDYVYVPELKIWMIWDDRRWVADRRLNIWTQTRAFLRQVASGRTEKESDRLKSDSTRSSVERTARSNPELVAGAEEWDLDKWATGTPGGVVEIDAKHPEAGQLRPARRDDRITRLTAATPAASGTRAPLWESFLRSTHGDKPGMVPFLQRYSGMLLAGEIVDQVIGVVVGRGGNGKSLFVNTLAAVMGDYAGSAASSTFLESAEEKHSTDLWAIRNARFVMANEIDPGKKWAGSRLKSMSGGDPITCRGMRQDPITYRPEYSILIVANHLPSFFGVDEAIRRRMLIIPFDKVIPPNDRDPYLAKKLKREWPAILRWMIDGCLEWQRVGLQPPDCVTHASQDYLDEEDELGQFLDESMQPLPSGFVYYKELYRVFRPWQEERGTRPWTQNAMVRALTERGYKRGRKASGRGVPDYTINQLMSAPYRDATRGM